MGGGYLFHSIPFLSDPNYLKHSKQLIGKYNFRFVSDTTEQRSFAV